MIDISFVGLPS